MAEAVIDSEYPALLHELTALAKAVGAGDDAEDIAQETILHARGKLAQLRDQDSLRPWLRRSVVRRTVAYKRRAARWIHHDTSSWSPDDAGLGMDLGAAFTHLSRRERSAVALVYGLGYSQEDAAAAMGLSRGTIATLLFRSRRKLAHALVDYRN